MVITKYFSNDQSRRMRYVGRVARMGERKGAYRVLVGKPEGKRQLRRHRRRWKTISRRIYRKRVGVQKLD
jgi:hypothetical protein